MGFNAHTLSTMQVTGLMDTRLSGLSSAEAHSRLLKYGVNAFPESPKSRLHQIFIRQFLNPLIYILIIAVIVALSVGELTDAGFILFVLLVNAIIGTIQEYGAEKSAESLKSLTKAQAYVKRDNLRQTIPADQLVLGDIVILESGQRVPADLRLVESNRLTIDESILSGESEHAQKNAETTLKLECPLADRTNMAYAATIVDTGRALGVVIATGSDTELGKIAHTVVGKDKTQAPLLTRMNKFTIHLAMIFSVFILLLGAIYVWQGAKLTDVLILSVSLAVAAVPEGLPIAITIALAIAMKRMSKKHVIVRSLASVEALGSCTYIASDKTGTLTVNELTVQKIILADFSELTLTGEGYQPKGEVFFSQETHAPQYRTALENVVLGATLCNESTLEQNQKDGSWLSHGDAVDIAMLVAAYKIRDSLTSSLHSFDHPLDNNLALQMRDFQLVDALHFEPINRFAAFAYRHKDKTQIFVKGAVETILTMCSKDQINARSITTKAEELANSGYRVIALAHGSSTGQSPIKNQLQQLTFDCLIGLKDPIRPDAKHSIEQAKQAGLRVAMITGDHPLTALSIAKDLNLAQQSKDVVTGVDVQKALDNQTLRTLVQNVKVFARIEPTQKLEIVRALSANGHFVAVTGDGANDAPALKEAHVGIAMGKSGTDVAKETSDLILTDDKFSSIIAGIQVGRIAYNNVRKIIFLLLSTGAAEIVLFLASISLGLPLPLTAIQLLWLNLVTEGIQDVSLAFEPGEGDELTKPPRRSNEPIFNRFMIERILLTAFSGGLLGTGIFSWALNHHYSEVEARNLLLLFMVLFENIVIGVSRSESRSAFLISPLSNPLLLIAVLGSQALHLLAINTSFLQNLLSAQPVTLYEWGVLALLSLIVFLLCEFYLVIYNYMQNRKSQQLAKQIQL